MNANCSSGNDEDQAQIGSGLQNVNLDNGTSEKFIETFFNEGSLGVTLRRRPEDGIVFIFEVVPNSQAINFDVQPMDELWAVGDSEIGDTPLDKDAWNGLISFIKTSERPLRLVWHRKASLQTNTSGSSSGSPIQQPPRVNHSPEYLELQKLLGRLVIRDKDPKTPPQTRKLQLASLLQENRKILRSGELNMTIKSNNNNSSNNLNNLVNAAFWLKGSEKRRVILLNDLLMITIPQTAGNIYAVEYVIELSICKIRSLHGQILDPSHMNRSESPTTSAMMDQQQQQLQQVSCSSFDLIAPMVEVTFFAESIEMKEVWVLNIYLAICDTIDESQRAVGWRHQHMLGTMHSAVICREEERIMELIQHCHENALDFTIIESPDEDGYTPLHYACILRLTNIVRILHEATADVTATDHSGLTPIHWAALQLDDTSLALLCEHVFDLDILVDHRNRSPLALLCMEGKDIHGRTDALALQRCLTIMLAHKPSIHWYDETGGRTIIHALAASWLYEGLESLLEYDCNDANSLDSFTHRTPLHYAVLAQPFKKKVGEGMKILQSHRYAAATTASISPTNQVAELDEVEELHLPYGVDTMRVLLKAGARPNLKDNTGKNVLSCLLDRETIARWDREEILLAIALLLSFGARVEESHLAVIKAQFPEISQSIPSFVEKWTSLQGIDCNLCNIKAGHFEIIPDPDRDLTGADGISPPLPSASLSDATAASDKCQLCGFVFTLFRRQHHCRLCNQSCCDECSKKRCSLDNAQVRVCDSCFNRALAMQEKEQQENDYLLPPSPPPVVRTASTDYRRPSGNAPSFPTSLYGQDIVKPLAATSSSSNSSNAKDEQQQASRLRLFGNSTTSNTNNNNNNTNQSQQQQQQAGRANTTTNRTMQSMNEAHERLQERGEKLAQLSNRTEDMANSANEFAKLAKQLNEQSKSRWF